MKNISNEKKPKKVNNTNKQIAESYNEIDIIDKKGRPPQKECLGKMIYVFKNKEYYQGIINWPPGLGKTRTGINIVKAFFRYNKDCNILWVSHRKNIVSSQLKQFDDLKISYVVYNNTKKQEIQKLTEHVIIILRQSLVKIDNYVLPKISGIIHDECHNATSSKNVEYVTTYNQLIKFTDVKFRIGMSGTPVTLSKFQNDGLLKLYGTENKINYLSSITLFDGVTGGYLLKPKIYYKQLKTENNKFDVKSIANELISLFKQDVNKFTYFKGIVWVNSISDVNKVYNLLQDKIFLSSNGKEIKIYKSTSKYDKDDDEFTKSLLNCVMVACDKFTIGYDATNIEFCVNFRLNEDGGVFIQKLGRVSRKKDNENVTHGIMYQYYTEESTEKITNKIIDAIIRNFENISTIIPMLSHIKKENIIEEIESIEEFKNIDMFLKCIEYDELNKNLVTEITYENLLLNFIQKIKLSNSDVKLIEDSNELTNWIAKNKKYPTKDTNTENKQIVKLDDEPKFAVLMESVKKRYDKLKYKNNTDEFTKLAINTCEMIPGWVPSKIIKDDQKIIYEKYKNIHGIKYSDILHDIVNVIISPNKFSDKVRNDFGKQLAKFINKNNFVTTLDILKEILDRKYAVNPHEQIKILYYCNILLSNLQTTITTNIYDEIESIDDDIEVENVDNDNIDIDNKNIKLQEDTKCYLQKVRLHQDKYRTQLFKRYDAICMISKVTNKKVLQACHIKPHCECLKNEMYDINNGLIFRSDIHILYDDYEFTIDPITLEIITNINDDYYKNLFKGNKLNCKLDANTRKYLQIHFNEYNKKNNKVEKKLIL
jgi:superfamily II DNA or RNA helicase